MRRNTLRNTIPVGLAIAILLFTAFAPSSLAYRDPHHVMKSTQGPNSIDYKYAVCGDGISIIRQQAPPTMVCPLVPAVFDALGTGPGVVSIDTSPYNQPFPYPHYVRVWVEHAGGLAPPDPFYGFSITVCNDRDDDGVCTNQDTRPTGDHWLHPWYDDQFKSQYSNPPLIGEPCKQYAYEQDPHRPPVGPEKTDDPGKDSKDCGDPTDAQVWMCLMPDTFEREGGQQDGKFDDLWVFISEWVDDPVYPNEKENVGTGISTGRYDVYVEYFIEESCEPWD